MTAAADPQCICRVDLTRTFKRNRRCPLHREPLEQACEVCSEPIDADREGMAFGPAGQTIHPHGSACYRSAWAGQR